MSEFVSDLEVSSVGPGAKEAKHFAMRHSENSPHLWVVVKGDGGWHQAMVASLFNPCLGRIVARYRAGRLVRQ